MTAISKPKAYPTDSDPALVEAISRLRENYYDYRTRRKWGFVGVRIAVQDGKPGVIHEESSASTNTRNSDHPRESHIPLSTNR